MKKLLSLVPLSIIVVLITNTSYTKDPNLPLQLAIDEVANTLALSAVIEPIVYASNMYTIYQSVKTLEYGWFTGAKTDEEKRITSDRYYEHFKKAILGVSLGITARLVKWIRYIYAGKTIIALAV